VKSPANSTEVLASNGGCKTFDMSADGFSRGEGIAAIYIKSLGDCIKDNDSIHAVIRSSASNCDGRTPGLSTPSSEAQEDLIRRTYQQASLDPTNTVFFQAHGTGTKTGR